MDIYRPLDRRVGFRRSRRREALGHPPPPAAGGGLPKEAYTPWLTRVIAFVIDNIPTAILSTIGIIVLMTMQKVENVCVTDISEFDLGEFCATGNNGPSATAWIIFVVCMLAALAYAIWNYGYRQGTTGSSVGKSFAKFKVVSEKTGQPIGFAPSIIRQIAHAVDGIIFYIGYLFPLWDAKRQTIADKIMSTICVPLQVPISSDRNLP